MNKSVKSNQYLGYPTVKLASQCIVNQEEMANGELESALQSYEHMLQDASGCDDMLQHGAALSLEALKNLARHASDATMKLEKMMHMDKGRMFSFDASINKHGMHHEASERHMSVFGGLL